MPRFPNSDSELIAGLQENPNFPSPPISSVDLRNRLDAFVSLCDAQTSAQAAAEQATAAKSTEREQLAAQR